MQNFVQVITKSISYLSDIKVSLDFVKGETMAKKEKIPDASVAILVAMSDNFPRHGYGIMKEVKQVTGDRIPNGTLYRLLAGLLDGKMIGEVDVPPKPGEKPRRYYKITGLGEQRARAEMEKTNRLVQWAKGRGLISPSSLWVGGL